MSPEGREHKPFPAFLHGWDREGNVNVQFSKRSAFRRPQELRWLAGFGFLNQESYEPGSKR